MNYRERKLYLNKYGADFQIVRAKKAINYALIIALVLSVGYLFLMVKAILLVRELMY